MQPVLPSTTDPQLTRQGEQGWALLGLLLFLAILGIILSSSVVPNIQFQVKRDKEAELIYRGQQMAEALGRYYNRGRLGPVTISMQSPLPYGNLVELKKLLEPVRINSTELKFVRASAMIDPLANEEWEPIRLYDPRIRVALQAYSAYNNSPIPPALQALAGPRAPTISVFGPTRQPGQPAQPGQPGQAGQPGQTGTGSRDEDEDDEDEDDEDEDEDEEDEDDEDENPSSTTDSTTPDPFAPLFENGRSNAPIVAVAPRVRGQSIRAFNGLDQYKDWIFFYVPPIREQVPRNQPNPGGRPARPRN